MLNTGHMTRTGSEATRTPGQSRAMRNDSLILNAALAIADDRGWSGLTLAAVAGRAGLSRQAAVSRYRDRSDLAADLWTKRLAEPISTALADLVAACPQPGDTPSGGALLNALARFIEPDEQMRAAAELLLVARYNQVVRAAIDSSIGQSLDGWLSPRARRLTRAQAARHAYLISMGLGLLMQARRFPLPAVDLTQEVEQTAAALAAKSAPRTLPHESLTHLDRRVDFGTEDPDLENVLNATYDAVAAEGYEAATLNVIARAAGCTEGLIFARYDTKWQLFLDATERMSESAVKLNDEYWRSIAESHSEGIAQAASMREFMLPSRKRPTTVYMEQCRLSWHDEELLSSLEASFADTVWQIANRDDGRSTSELRAYVYTGIALGFGVMVLADLYPDAWQLPFDVVTVPLMDGVSGE